MANNFKIKKGLIINDTQPITGITNNSGFTNGDIYTIPTMNATKGYIDSKTPILQDTQILFNSGGTLTGSTSLTYDGNDMFVSGNTKTPFGMYSKDGAMCIKMINKTGESTIIGKLVTYYLTSGNSFTYYPSGNTTLDPYIGLTTENGISDGQYTYIAIYGICDVKISSYSLSVKYGDVLSSYDSTSNGDILKDVGDWSIGYALEDGNPGDTIKCFLYNNDTQTPGGYY